MLTTIDKAGKRLGLKARAKLDPNRAVARHLVWIGRAVLGGSGNLASG